MSMLCGNSHNVHERTVTLVCYRGRGEPRLWGRKTGCLHAEVGAAVFCTRSCQTARTPDEPRAGLSCPQHAPWERTRMLTCCLGGGRKPFRTPQSQLVFY